MNSSFFGGIQYLATKVDTRRLPRPNSAKWSPHYHHVPLCFILGIWWCWCFCAAFIKRDVSVSHHSTKCIRRSFPDGPIYIYIILWIFIFSFQDNIYRILACVSIGCNIIQFCPRFIFLKKEHLQSILFLCVANLQHRSMHEERAL